MIVSAHDGYPRLLNSGADFIEIDIRRTPEGVIVLAHDEVRPHHRYPTFDEVLEGTGPEMGLHLDLKEKGFEVELVGRALQTRTPDKVVVTPDFVESAQTIKQHFPEVRVSPIDFLALDQQYATDQALDQGVPIWVWTVDDKRLMQRFIKDKRIEAIITNRPDLALRLRSERG